MNKTDATAQPMVGSFVKQNMLCHEVTTLLTKDNRPYLKMTLVDGKNNHFPAIMFNSDTLTIAVEKGEIYTITGNYQEYNSTMQVKVVTIEEGTSSIEEFLPKSIFNPNDMLENLEAIIRKHITTPHLLQLAECLLNDTHRMEAFTKSPAAKALHHATVYGLLEHTLSVVRLALSVCDFYRTTTNMKINREHVILGALFHDLGKIDELTMVKGFDYTTNGRLTGHIVGSARILEAYARTLPDFPEEELDLLLHIIYSHHGLLEFGSPQVPKTIEAFLLSRIDDLDAKMNSIQGIFEKNELEEGEWSYYDRFLERQMYRHSYGS